jgi:hypothetical protein
MILLMLAPTDQDAVLFNTDPGGELLARIREVIYSGDPVQDKNAAAAFVARYGVMHRWRNLPDGAQIVLVGADNFPFPIPLKKNPDGRWFFDAMAAKDELLNHRIGRNELVIVEICGAVADAEAVYFSHPHDSERTKQYAAKFISDPGKQNGLHWKSPDGQPASPVGAAGGQRVR